MDAGANVRLVMSAGHEKTVNISYEDPQISTENDKDANRISALQHYPRHPRFINPNNKWLGRAKKNG